MEPVHKIKTEVFLPLVRRANPNNMRYKNNRPINGRQHIYSPIFHLDPEQNRNPVASQNYSPTGSPITDMYNIDQISYNKYRPKQVDFQN